jgi:hypothetical protein
MCRSQSLGRCFAWISTVLFLGVTLVFSVGCSGKVDWYILSGFDKGADGQIGAKYGLVPYSSGGWPSRDELTQAILSNDPSFFSQAPAGEMVILDSFPGGEQAKTLLYQKFGDVGYRLQAFKVTGTLPALATTSSSAVITPGASEPPTAAAASSAPPEPAELMLDAASSALLDSEPFVHSIAKFSIRPPKGWKVEGSSESGMPIVVLRSSHDDANVIISWQDLQGLSLDEFVKAKLEGASPSIPFTDGPRKVSVNETPAYIASSNSPEGEVGHTQLWQVMAGGGTAYVVIATALTSDWQWDKPLLTAALLSFKLEP